MIATLLPNFSEIFQKILGKVIEFSLIFLAHPRLQDPLLQRSRYPLDLVPLSQRNSLHSLESFFHFFLSHFFLFIPDDMVRYLQFWRDVVILRHDILFCDMMSSGSCKSIFILPYFAAKPHVHLCRRILRWHLSKMSDRCQIDISRSEKIADSLPEAQAKSGGGFFNVFAHASPTVLVLNFLLIDFALTIVKVKFPGIFIWTFGKNSEKFLWSTRKIL